MANWRRTGLVTGVLAVVTLLSACASPPPIEIAMSTVPTERLKIYDLRAYAAREGLRIEGKVRRPRFAVGPIWGHLHVTGRFADGRPPVSMDTRWGNLPARGGHFASFSGMLRTATPADIQSVTVELRGSKDRAGDG